MHTSVQKHWSNSSRLHTKTGGAITQMRSSLEALLQEISRKNLQIGELLELKGKESTQLHSRLKQSFKKHSEMMERKVLAKTSMELTNHLNHVGCALESSKTEIKRLQNKAHKLARLIRIKAA